MTPSGLSDRAAERSFVTSQLAEAARKGLVLSFNVRRALALAGNAQPSGRSRYRKPLAPPRLWQSLLYLGRKAATVASMSITATVENNTIKLPAGVHLPDGTPVRVEPIGPGARNLAERYAEMIGIADDLPADLAKNLDHYVHGHPKRA